MQMPGNPLFVNNAFFEQVCSHTRLLWQRSDRSECQPEEKTPEKQQKRQSRIFYFDARALTNFSFGKSVTVEYSTLTLLRQSRIFYFDAKPSK